MEEENKFAHSEKIKGIFFNYRETPSENFKDISSKWFRNYSYKLLSEYGQSVHHVNFYNTKEKLTSIYIAIRENGIKPEDVDGRYLMNKKLNSEISGYENLLLKLWLQHNNFDEKKFSEEERENFEEHIVDKFKSFVGKYENILKKYKVEITER